MVPLIKLLIVSTGRLEAAFPLTMLTALELAICIGGGERRWIGLEIRVGFAL